MQTASINIGMDFRIKYLDESTYVQRNMERVYPFSRMPFRYIQKITISGVCPRLKMLWHRFTWQPATRLLPCNTLLRLFPMLPQQAIATNRSWKDIPSFQRHIIS